MVRCRRCNTRTTNSDIYKGKSSGRFESQLKELYKDFDGLQEFARLAKRYVPKVTLSIVDHDLTPEEIETCRSIAEKCGVTATTIYRYYKDKEDLFRKISLDNLERLNFFLEKRVSKIDNPKEKLIAALKAFRDWCFENPRTAQLFMGKISVDDNASEAEIESFYTSQRFGQKLLENCLKNNSVTLTDTKCHTDLIIFSLWGCIESVLLKRSDPEYWSKGIEFTDQFIDVVSTRWLV
mgnify:CR=1 FL=1